MGVHFMIAIYTKRYSTFFRRMVEEYQEGCSVQIDRKVYRENEIPDLISTWCKNKIILNTRDFTLLRDKKQLFGFHDHPEETWAEPSEMEFIKRMAKEHIIRYTM